MKKFFVFFLLCSVFVHAANQTEAMAFWKKKKAPAAPVQKMKSVGGVRIFEGSQYMVLFSIYPIGDEKPLWSEIGYKLVDRTGEPGKLFGATEWVEIRFQDKDGFNIIAAPVRFENPKTEYYGFVRIENAKAAQIARIDLQPLKESEIPKEEPVPASAAAASPSPVESPSQAPSPVPSPPANSPEPSAVPAASPSLESPAPASSPEPAGPGIPSGVITNEVIQKTFEEMDKKAAPPAEGADPAPAEPKVNAQ